MKDGERGRRVETTMNNCRRARGRSDVIDGSLQEAEGRTRERELRRRVTERTNKRQGTRGEGSDVNIEIHYRRLNWRGICEPKARETETDTGTQSAERKHSSAWCIFRDRRLKTECTKRMQTRMQSREQKGNIETKAILTSRRSYYWNRHCDCAVHRIQIQFR